MSFIPDVGSKFTRQQKIFCFSRKNSLIFGPFAVRHMHIHLLQARQIFPTPTSAISFTLFEVDKPFQSQQHQCMAPGPASLPRCPLNRPYTSRLSPPPQPALCLPSRSVPAVAVSSPPVSMCGRGARWSSRWRACKSHQSFLMSSNLECPTSK